MARKANEIKARKEAENKAKRNAENAAKREPEQRQKRKRTMTNAGLTLPKTKKIRLNTNQRRRNVQLQIERMRRLTKANRRKFLNQLRAKKEPYTVLRQAKALNFARAGGLP